MKYAFVFAGILALIALVTCENSPRSPNSSRELPIQSDPQATYIIVEKGGTVDQPTLTTKRIGTSGENYSKRIFDCRDGTYKKVLKKKKIACDYGVD